jgi:hypothetical protein
MPPSTIRLLPSDNSGLGVHCGAVDIRIISSAVYLRSIFRVTPSSSISIGPPKIASKLEAGSQLAAHKHLDGIEKHSQKVLTLRLAAAAAARKIGEAETSNFEFPVSARFRCTAESPQIRWNSSVVAMRWDVEHGGRMRQRHRDSRRSLASLFARPNNTAMIHSNL